MKTENTLKTECRRNTISLGLWTAVWVLTLALVSFGHEFLWNHNPTFTIILISVNTLVGIGMVIANIRHLNSLDELQRKISLEAMGIALGVTLVGGISYSMLDVTNMISYDAEISFLIILMGLTYLAAITINKYRYR